MTDQRVTAAAVTTEKAAVRRVKCAKGGSSRKTKPKDLAFAMAQRRQIHCLLKDSP